MTAMTREFRIGDRVRSLRSFCSVTCGTVGVVVEDYGSGITIAWDGVDGKPAIPEGMTPEQVGQMFAVNPKCPLRDGFNKETELQFLELIND